MSKEIIIEVYSKIYYISKQKISYSQNNLLLTYMPLIGTSWNGMAWNRVIQTQSISHSIIKGSKKVKVALGEIHYI